MTCKDCIYSPICKVYADFGLTDVPYDENDTCEMFKSNSNLVEVVRCKDCRSRNGGITRPEGRSLCERLSRWVWNTDFCNLGERKEGV